MRLGFIGTGNMGSSIIGGAIKSNFIVGKNVNIYDLDTEKCSELVDKYSVNISENEIEVTKNSDIIILAVKPNIYNSVLSKIAEEITQDKIIITIAAGYSISQVQEIIGKDKKIVRTMPNTPALVGEGMSAICPNNNVSEEELNYIGKLYNLFGKYVVIAEKDFHAFIALCGSSPAYVFMFIEAMADAAVIQGMPRAQAYRFAAQAVLGSAKMVLESKSHPGELKDMVCSPGGTTIEAVAVLEEKGMRSAVIEAMRKCAQKSKGM